MKYLLRHSAVQKDFSKVIDLRQSRRLEICEPLKAVKTMGRLKGGGKLPKET
jgi:hypothetical protein